MYIYVFHMLTVLFVRCVYIHTILLVQWSEIWIVSYIVENNFLLNFAFILVSIHNPTFTYDFLSDDFTLK